jgi:hypothetical protein
MMVEEVGEGSATRLVGLGGLAGPVWRRRSKEEEERKEAEAPLEFGVE